jgi:hypothetical protein
VPYANDEDAHRALQRGSIIGFSGNPATVANATDVAFVRTERVLTRSGWFRRERLLAEKVQDVSELPSWKHGNEDLAQTYEAAINAMKQQDVVTRIFDRYPDVDRVAVADCFVSSGAYRVPTTPSGTLKRIVDSREIKIGAVEGDIYPLIRVNKTHQEGVLVEIEHKIVEWMAKLVGSDEEIAIKRIVLASQDEVFASLIRGEIDATYSYMFQGGFFGNTTRRLLLRSSCSMDSYALRITLLASWNITSVLQLGSFLARYKDATIGAVTEYTADVLKLLFPSSKPRVYQSNKDAL